MFVSLLNVATQALNKPSSSHAVSPSLEVSQCLFYLIAQNPSWCFSHLHGL